MSRIRIVGGKIIKNTVGEHSIFSKGNIILNAKGRIIQEGKEKGVHFGEPEKYISLKKEILPKCIVHFRPHDNYQDNPDFGFDWERLGDSGQGGDHPWKDIVGENTADLEMYNQLINTYTLYQANWKKDAQGNPFIYTVSVLNLFEGKTALLNIFTEIEEQPQKLTFEFQNPKAKECFQIDREGITEIQKGETTLKDYIKITCIQTSPNEQLLLVKADGQLCGALKILPNTPKYISELNLVMFRVITNINDENKIGEIEKEQQNLITSILGQALVKVNIVTNITLDCTGDTEIIRKFCEYNEIKERYSFIDNDKRKGLLRYLRNKQLEVYKNTYKKYFYIFFINEPYTLGGGFAHPQSTARSSIFFNIDESLFPNRKNPVNGSAHELLHSLMLPHSFEKQVQTDFVFKIYHTNNVMDYSHLARPPVKGISLYQWQWKKVYDQLKKIIY